MIVRLRHRAKQVQRSKGILPCAITAILKLVDGFITLFQPGEQTRIPFLYAANTNALSRRCPTKAYFSS